MPTCLFWTLDDALHQSAPQEMRERALEGLPIPSRFTAGPFDAAQIRLFDPVGPAAAPRTGGLGGLLDAVGSVLKSGRDVSLSLINKFVNPWSVARADRGFDNVLQGTIRTANKLNREVAIQLERHQAPFETLTDEALEPLKRLFDKHRNDSPEAFLQAVRAADPALEAPARALRDITLDNWAYLKSTGRVAPDAQPVMNYLPIVRETALVDQVLSIELNRPISQIRQVPVTADEAGALTGYVPDPLYKLVPTKAQEFFLKSRTVGIGAETLSFRDRLDVYARAFARQKVMDQYVKEVAPGLNAIDPRFQQYAANFVNDFLGKPGARAEGQRTAISFIKEIEAARTLAGALTPLVNKTQIGNVLLTGVGFKNMMRGVAAGQTEEIGLLAKAVGLPVDVLAGPYAGDLVATAQGEGIIPAFRRYIRGETNNTILNALSPLTLFAKSESGAYGNIRQAFAAGLYEAKDRGLAGADALRFAMDVTERSQFTASIGRTPEMFRGGTWTSLVGQMKSFNLAQIRLLKDAVVDNPMGLAKWLIAGATLFGPDFIWPGIEEGVTKHLFGEATRTPGLIPYMGAALAERAGMGFDANDIRRMMAFLPGPAIAHLADAATGLGYLAFGSGTVNFTKLLSIDMPGAMQGGVTADEAARSLTRALPIFGVAVDRVRRAVKEMQAGGEQREGLDLAESFGLKPASGKLTGERLEPFEMLMVSVGLQSDKMLGEIKQVRAERDLDQARRRMLHEARQFLAAGRTDDAVAVAQRYEQITGEVLRLTRLTRPEREQQALTPIERLQKAPGVRRSPALQEALRPTRPVWEVLGGETQPE